MLSFPKGSSVFKKQSGIIKLLADLDMIRRNVKFKESSSGSTLGSEDVIDINDEEFIITKFGYIVDPSKRIMWMRGVWGSEWNGQDFSGNPEKFHWKFASRLFGEGKPTQGIQAALTKTSITYESGYEVGRNRVYFSGFDDWRMPIASELVRFLNKDIDIFRQYHQKLFPNLEAMNFWSATPLGGGLAWALDGQCSSLGDYRFEESRPVLLMRNY